MYPAPSSLIVSDDNWFVLIGTSKFYFNYRHTANVLSVYNILKRQGVRDDRVFFISRGRRVDNPDADRQLRLQPAQQAARNYIL